MKKTGIWVLTVAAGLATGTVQAGDAERGKALSATCATCHGAQGISAAPAVFPDLAGRPADTLASMLKAFRSGERQNAIMAPQAASLSDQDIADLAAYFASLPPR